MEDDKNIIQELEDFLKELAMYHYLQRKQVKSEHLTPDELRLVTRLRSTLLRKSGEFKSVITDEDRKENMRTFWIDGKESLYDIWNTGLKFDFDWLASEALDYCKDATDVAIGKLESDIKKGKRDKQGNLIKLEKPQSSSAKPPKAFIAHEGETQALNKLKTFLDALGVTYLIAEIEPSNGRVVEGQVDWTQGQADFAIILATKGKIVNKTTGKPQMGTNVADELGRARVVFRNRIILLLETGLEAHTNVGGIVRARFMPQSMDKAFEKIVNELKNWGFIRVGKAEEQKT